VAALPSTARSKPQVPQLPPPEHAVSTPNADEKISTSHSKEKNNIEKRGIRTYDNAIDIASTIAAEFAALVPNPELRRQCAMRAAAAIEREQTKVEQPSNSDESVAVAFAGVADDLPTVEIPAPGDHPMFPGRPADPEAFFAEHWAGYVPHGLTQALLRKRDAKLMKSLENRFKGNPERLSQIVPSSSYEIDKIYEAEFGMPLPPKGSAERRTALQAASAIRTVKQRHEKEAVRHFP
jgi:hypothetical protein